jgi:hypothetical protein
MVISASITSKVKIDPLISVFEDEFNRMAGEIGKEVGEDAKDELETYFLYSEPGAVKRPIQWTSERQRRAFFATNGFGKGIPTRRTRSIINAWEVGVNSEAGMQINIKNENPATRYVVGSLQQDVRQATRFMQQFHRNTGWQPVSIEVNKILKTVRETYEERFRRELSTFGTVVSRKVSRIT